MRFEHYYCFDGRLFCCVDCTEDYRKALKTQTHEELDERALKKLTENYRRINSGKQVR
jgi:hypothetical protein